MAIRTLFNPEHPEKYKGDLPIEVKSLWELDFAKYCDRHPDVMQWTYEPTKIPYHDPISGRQKIYIPDFLVTFITRGRQATTKLIEIKPQGQAWYEQSRNSKDALLTLKNDAKWKAATNWALRRGVDFIIMTEADMYKGADNVPARKNPLRPERILAQVKKADPKKPGRAAKKAQKKRNPSTRSRGSMVKRAARVSTVKKVGKARRV